MKILHLNSYFIDNPLYYKLYLKLKDKVHQSVYVPIKWNRTPATNENEGIELTYSKIIKRVHRVLYTQKILRILNDIATKIDVGSFDFIHAHNLFIDGAVAYELKKKNGVPYIVALRSTDIELQYKFMFHRRNYANEILKNANKIIFISKVYEQKFLNLLNTSLQSFILNKLLILPNGIDDFWLNNLNKERKTISENNVRLLFVGQIIKRKNILQLLDAFSIIKRNYADKNFQLTIVGGSYPAEIKYYEKLLKVFKSNSSIKYLGKISDNNHLKQVFSENHIFVMPSFRELFGIVYIEALSQGLPVIYSKNEGIDKLFSDGEVGYSVDPYDSKDIARGIINTIENYTKIQPNCSDKIGVFDWSKIADKYMELYRET